MVMADIVDNDKLSAGEGALAADSTSAADYDIARYVSTHVDHWNDYVAYTAGFRFYSTLGKEFENSDAKDAAKTLFKQIIAHHSETAAPTVRPAHNTDASAQNQSEHGFSIFSTPADSSNDNDAESAAIPSELKGYTNILYMKVSEVNALLQHLGKPTVSLADNQVALLALMEPSYKALAPYVTGDIPVGVGGHNVTLTTLLDYNDFVGIFTGYPITLVVPDSFIDNSSQLYGCSAIGFLKDTSREAQQSFIRDVLGTSKHPATWENNIQAPWNKISIVNLYQVVVMGSVLKGIGSFMAIYLGLILLVAAACLLAIQQLTQALDTRHDYTKLLQLGATTGMASRALFAQVCFYFFVPAALALVHALQFITAIKVEIGSLSQAGGILAQILAVVLVGYIGYFVICYIISRSICLKQAS